MAKQIGILTSGGDCPGLNAAIHDIGKAADGNFGMKVIGFRNGFSGLAEGRFQQLDGKDLSGIITIGGTIPGTSRDKPHRMTTGGKIHDMLAMWIAASEIREQIDIEFMASRS